MTDPLGPLRLLMVTLTFVADLVAASRMRLMLMTSFFAPNSVIAVPFHKLFVTLCPRLARSSSRVTLSSPSFAHTAVMAVAASRRPEALPWENTGGSFRRHSAATPKTTLQDLFARTMSPTPPLFFGFAVHSFG